LKSRQSSLCGGIWALVVEAECWASRVYGGNARSQLLPDQETVTSKKSKRGFKITEGFLSYGSMLEFEARRSPYLESSSIITCGGPRSILAAAALRLR